MGQKYLLQQCIQSGVPGLLFLKEMIKEGIVIKKQQHKWMEYKFEITADGYLQYSVLNGKVSKLLPISASNCYWNFFQDFRQALP